MTQDPEIKGVEVEVETHDCGTCPTGKISLKLITGGRGHYSSSSTFGIDERTAIKLIESLKSAFDME